MIVLRLRRSLLAGFFLATTALSALGQTVSVTRYEVAGNTLLPATEVNAALAQHTGAKDLEGLRSAALVLQNSYRTAGFGAVVVTLPEQTLADGTVKLQWTESKRSQVHSARARFIGFSPRAIETNQQMALGMQLPYQLYSGTAEAISMLYQRQ